MTLSDPMLPSDLLDIGEAVASGHIKCKLCSKWCVSWQGLLIHYKKKHSKKPAVAQHHQPKPRKKPVQKPLTLWDLRYGGKRLDL
ncbi:MAG: hypothetical protein LUP94_04060 [Candidatus Methanomethylicus sp.]|nr:hypothetical protein [Candidatus Methanomethylicus sp.]